MKRERGLIPRLRADENSKSARSEVQVREQARVSSENHSKSSRGQICMSPVIG
jgi:hypothetical protein